ncbi:dna polymerase sigma subunit, partial [Trichoderma arundinaceum]
MVRNKPQRRNDDRGRNGHGEDRSRHGFRRSPPRFAPSRDRPYHDSDSWRPGDGRRPDSRSRPYNDDYRGGGGDSYRPHVPQGDFTFRVDKPAGISDYVPAGQLSHRRPPRRDGRGGGPPRRPGRPRWQPPPHHSERALISGITTGLPEESVHTGEGAKFRDLDDLSDDDELAMDISSRSSQSDTEEPSKKRVRTAVADGSADATPKWSNPDPYTALPCPDESTRKKRDVVKLIRKARLEDSSSKPAASTEAEDFLSFDLSDNEDAEEDDSQMTGAPPP